MKVVGMGICIFKTKRKVRVCKNFYAVIFYTLCSAESVADDAQTFRQAVSLGLPREAEERPDEHRKWRIATPQGQGVGGECSTYVSIYMYYYVLAVLHFLRCPFVL